MRSKNIIAINKQLKFIPKKRTFRSFFFFLSLSLTISIVSEQAKQKFNLIKCFNIFLHF
jgi:hypothetical protein